MNMTKAMELNLRRKELPWDDEIWNRIDRAVHDECKRTQIASKFLPLHGPVESGQLTVPSDKIIFDQTNNGQRNGNTLEIPEAETNNLIELVVEFTLTRQQLEREEELGSAITLATRATNLLCQACDIVIFQGQKAISGDNPHPLFRDRKVIVRSGPAGFGLLDAPEVPETLEALNSRQLLQESKQQQIVNVPSLDDVRPGNGSQQRWGENTFAAVSRAYAGLQSGEGLAQAHYGPYALVLNFETYADTYAPLPTTLIMPADRIARLVTEGFYGMGHSTEMSSDKGRQYHNNGTNFYGTGTVPLLQGMLVSLGGNTMDLVVGIDAKTEYLTQDNQGNYIFRVYKRFALRLKDSSAVIRLEFEK